MLLDLLFHHNRDTVFTDFPQPFGNTREASLPYRPTVAARVVITPSKIKVVFSSLTVHAKAVSAVRTGMVFVRGTSISASGRSRVKVFSRPLTSKTSTILATGRHDLSDEELITLFLELID